MKGEERGDLGLRWEDGGSEMEGRVDQGEGKGVCVFVVCG